MNRIVAIIGFMWTLAAFGACVGIVIAIAARLPMFEHLYRLVVLSSAFGGFIFAGAVLWLRAIKLLERLP